MIYLYMIASAPVIAYIVVRSAVEKRIARLRGWIGK